MTHVNRLSIAMLLALMLLPTLLWPDHVLADGPPICSTPNEPIPDFDNDTKLPGVVTDTITITGAGLITDLNVSILATHTWVGDLRFTLTHEDTGPGAILIDRPGTPPGHFGCGRNNIEAILDDEALEPVEDECAESGPTIAGPFAPNESLAAFDNEDLAGLWHLTVSDHASADHGALVQWCLIPSPQADLAVAKTVDEPIPAEGDLIVYTVTVDNNGPDGATNLVISDTLPLGVTFVEVHSSQGSYAGPTGPWNVGDLDPNAQATLTLSATVEPGTAGQTITNTAEVFTVDQFDGTGSNNRAEVSLMVALAELAVNKTVNKPQPNENDTIEYTVTVDNHGPTAATGVVLSDPLPAGVTFDTAGPTQGSYDANTGTWEVGALAVNGTATLILTATIDPDTAGQTITNTAAVSASNQTDLIEENNSDEAGLTVNNADLVVTKSVDDPNPTEHGLLRYTITLFNAGQVPATGIIIGDVLPAGLIFEAATADNNTLYNDAAGLWEAGKLLPGESAALTLSATVQAGTAGQIITNTAAVIAVDQSDADAANNSAEAAITVKNAELALTKTADTGRPTENGPLVYHITVTNNGPDEATTIVISDTLPLSLTLTSFSPSQGSYDAVSEIWEIDTLAAGLSATLTLSTSVTPGTAGQTITNTAVISAAQPGDSVEDNNSASVAVVVAAADLAVSKTAAPARPDENSLLVYTVTVTNTGPHDASGVVISDTLPLSVTLITSSTTQGSYDSSAGLWTAGELAQDAAATLLLTTTVAAGTAGQALINTAETSALDQTDLISANNTTTSVIIVTNANLSVTKTVDDPTPNENQLIHYTITIINEGPDDTGGVVISDTLPLSVTLVTSSTTQGSYDDSTGLWTVGDLPNTAGATLTLTTTVAAGAAGQTITNTAGVVASDQSDAETANNASEAVFTVEDADLAVSKTADTDLPFANGPLIYTVTVINHGPSDATGVIINDTLPLSVTLVASNTSQGSYDDNTGLWTVDDLAHTAGATLTLTTTLGIGTGGQPITNTAEVFAADQGDSVEGNNRDSMAVTGAIADLAVNKTVVPDQPVENSPLIYTVTLVNNGPDDAGGVVISDLLPLSVTLVTSSTTQGSYDDGTGLWIVGDVANGTGATLILNATVDPGSGGQTITNTAALFALNQTDDNDTNNSASAAITVNIEANVSISKHAVPEVGVVGAVLTYTVTISNEGPAQAVGVVMTDTLPAEVSFISVSPGTPTCDETAGTVSCDLGDLNAGEPITVTIIVSSTTTGIISNTAQVTALSPDPVPDNDTALLETMILAEAPGAGQMYLPVIIKED